MRKKNIGEHRHNLKVMSDCHDAFLINEYEKLITEDHMQQSILTEDDEVDEMPASLPSFVREFDDIKKRQQNSTSNFITDYRTMTN